MFMVACFQFGYAMYAALVGGEVDGREAPQWSDRRDEAEVYDHRDSRETKLGWWKAEAEQWGLDPESVRIVEAD